jgi:hypothetical protein
VLGQEHPNTEVSLENLALLEIDLGRIDEATALARQASAAELIVISKIFSFTSEEQRLAYLDIFRPNSLFLLLKGTETDLAAAVLRYKGVVLDSIVEDRLVAEASQGSEVQSYWSNSTWIKGNWASYFCNRSKSSSASSTNGDFASALAISSYV